VLREGRAPERAGWDLPGDPGRQGARGGPGRLRADGGLPRRRAGRAVRHRPGLHPGGLMRAAGRLLALAAAAGLFGAARGADAPPEPRVVYRLPGNPIVSPKSDASIGTNINGPSLIRVPGWVPNPLGAYYLYFAAHNG